MFTPRDVWDSTVWNPQEGRPRAFVRLLLHFVLWIVAGAALFRVLGGPISSLLIALAPPLEPLSPQLVTFLMRLIAALAGTWLAARYLDRREFRDLGMNLDGHWWQDLAFGLVLGAVLMTLIFVLEYSLSWISIRERFSVTMEGSVPFAIAILGPLFVFLVVGISEEIISRGYQLRNMAEGFNFKQRHEAAALLWAWLLSSAFFGLLHASNPNATWISTTYLMLAGMFLGLGLVLTGRLGLPIGLHISWNFFQGNVYGFPVSGNDYTGATVVSIQQGGPDLWTGGAFGPEAGLIGIGAIVLGCVLTLVWVRARYGRLALYRPYAVYRRPQPPASPSDFIAEDAEGTQIFALDKE